MTSILNKRQDLILDLLGRKGSSSISEIFAYVQSRITVVSRITVSRDLDKLIHLKLLIRKGAGRSTVYELSAEYSVIRPVDVESYFSKELDERTINKAFNFKVFGSLKGVFSLEEKQLLRRLNNLYLKKLKKLSKETVQKEFERLTIDLSWKSSRIEGNTYSLLETEQLLKEHREARGHSREEAIMIINHKKALDYTRSHLKSYKKISLKKIEEIHTLLVDKLGISKNLRKTLVRITGTRFEPLDNQFQIKEALLKTCSLVNNLEDPFEKALVLMLLVSYIQPFVDGNKRTSRLSGNAILLAYDCCPLSYRTIDEIEYKKAILLFYEQNNLSYFKKLFMEQFEFVVENYF